MCLHWKIIICFISFSPHTASLRGPEHQVIIQLSDPEKGAVTALFSFQMSALGLCLYLECQLCRFRMKKLSTICRKGKRYHPADRWARFHRLDLDAAWSISLTGFDRCQTWKFIFMNIQDKQDLDLLCWLQTCC